MRREINLLPPQRRQVLQRQTLLKMANRAVYFMMWAMVMVTVLVGGLWFTLRGWRWWQQGSPVAVEFEQQVKDYAELTKGIDEDNSQLSVMEQVLDERIVWSARVREVLEVVPPGVTVSKINGRQVSAENSIIELQGQALSRSVIVVLEDRLSDLPWVERVGSPATNFIQRSNAPYAFVLHMRPALESEQQ